MYTGNCGGNFLFHCSHSVLSLTVRLSLFDCVCVSLSLSFPLSFLLSLPLTACARDANWVYLVCCPPTTYQSGKRLLVENFMITDMKLCFQQILMTLAKTKILRQTQRSIPRLLNFHKRCFNTLTMIGSV